MPDGDDLAPREKLEVLDQLVGSSIDEILELFVVAGDEDGPARDGPFAQQFAKAAVVAMALGDFVEVTGVGPDAEVTHVHDARDPSSDFGLQRFDRSVHRIEFPVGVAHGADQHRSLAITCSPR